MPPSAKPPVLLLIAARGDSDDNTNANTKLEKELSDDGYDVKLLSLSNDEASDIRIKKTLVDNTYRLVLIDSEIKKTQAWYDRVKGLLGDTSSGKAVIVEPTKTGEAAKEVKEALPMAEQLE